MCILRVECRHNWYLRSHYEARPIMWKSKHYADHSSRLLHVGSTAPPPYSPDMNPCYEIKRTVQRPPFSDFKWPKFGHDPTYLRAELWTANLMASKSFPITGNGSLKPGAITLNDVMWKLTWMNKFDWFLAVCALLLKWTSYNVKLKPYRIFVQKELQHANYTKHIPSYEWLQCFSHHAGASHFDLVYLSDKAWVHLNDYVNSQNYCFWYSKNHRECVESGLQPEKIGIRCGILRKKLNFLKQQLMPLTINKLFKILWWIWMRKTFWWFQQDGATVHTAAPTMDFCVNFLVRESFRKIDGLLAVQIYHDVISSCGAIRKTKFFP